MNAEDEDENDKRDLTQQRQFQTPIRHATYTDFGNHILAAPHRGRLINSSELPRLTIINKILTSSMLVNSDPLLWLFCVFLGAILGGPALYLLLYLIVHLIVWLSPPVDEEQHIGIPLVTLGEISL